MPACDEHTHNAGAARRWASRSSGSRTASSQCSARTPTPSSCTTRARPTDARSNTSLQGNQAAPTFSTRSRGRKRSPATASMAAKSGSASADASSGLDRPRAVGVAAVRPSRVRSTATRLRNDCSCSSLEAASPRGRPAQIAAGQDAAKVATSLGDGLPCSAGALLPCHRGSSHGRLRAVNDRRSLVRVVGRPPLWQSKLRGPRKRRGPHRTWPRNLRRGPRPASAKRSRPGQAFRRKA